MCTINQFKQKKKCYVFLNAHVEWQSIRRYLDVGSAGSDFRKANVCEIKFHVKLVHVFTLNVRGHVENYVGHKCDSQHL